MRLNGQILLIGFGTAYHSGANQQWQCTFSITPFKMVLVCESQHFIVCVKVKAIGQEGQPNLLDSDRHPPSLEERPQLSPAYICPNKLINLAFYLPVHLIYAVTVIIMPVF